MRSLDALFAFAGCPWEIRGGFERSLIILTVSVRACACPNGSGPIKFNEFSSFSFKSVAVHFGRQSLPPLGALLGGFRACNVALRCLWGP